MHCDRIRVFRVRDASGEVYLDCCTQVEASEVKDLEPITETVPMFCWISLLLPKVLNGATTLFHLVHETGYSGRGDRWETPFY